MVGVGGGWQEWVVGCWGLRQGRRVEQHIADVGLYSLGRHLAQPLLERPCEAVHVVLQLRARQHAPPDRRRAARRRRLGGCVGGGPRAKVRDERAELLEGGAVEGDLRAPREEPEHRRALQLHRAAGVGVGVDRGGARQVGADEPLQRSHERPEVVGGGGGGKQPVEGLEERRWHRHERRTELVEPLLDH